MLSPKEIAENYLNIAKNKTSMSCGKTFVLAIMAGMFIAFAGVGSSVASCMVDNPSVSKLIAGCIFPAGLAMVILAGSELFTGNCLLFIGVLQKKIKCIAMIKNLILVYLGNFVGSLIVSLIVVYSGTINLFSNGFGEAVIKTAQNKCSLGFLEAILLGIGCNFLVCIAVWMAFAAKTPGGKVAAIFFPILAFVVSGFEHSVANMYYLSAGFLAKTTGEFVANSDAINLFNITISNLLPVTIGNIIGGMVLIALPYWFVYLKATKKA